MRVLPMGRRAVLLEQLGAEPAAIATVVRDQIGAVVVDVVPAAETVLITVAREADLPAVVDRLTRLDVGRLDQRASEMSIEIAVTYDGPDLADVAATTGLGVDEVVALHHGASYHVDFCGFAPGFAYLSGLPERLRLPRRATPRTRVPAGSVAIAAGYSAVYPTVSPGGWHLIGSTDVVLFDSRRDPPALLTPGATVRFVPT